MPTKEGRITLTDTHFKIIKNEDIIENEIKNEEEFNNYLKKYFRLDLDDIKSWFINHEIHETLEKNKTIPRVLVLTFVF